MSFSFSKDEKDDTAAPLLNHGSPRLRLEGPSGRSKRGRVTVLLSFVLGAVLAALLIASHIFGDFAGYSLTNSSSHTSSHGTSADKGSEDPCANVPLVNGGTLAQPGNGQLVLVTGGAGFIGSNLVDRLLQLGYRVRIYDNLYTGFLRNVPLTHPDVEFALGDILDHATLSHALRDVDYVYHLAAMSKVVPSLKDPDMARFCTEANALGSWNVLDAVRRQGRVKKVVYAASSTYYGNLPPPHSEDMPPDFLTPYAASKFEGEIQMQMFDRLFGVPTVSTRFFMVYGPRQPSTGAYAIVTGVFAKQAADGRALTIEGDGTHYRDFIHVRDIIEGMIISQQAANLRGQVVNLGSGITFSVNDVANLISPKQVHVAPRPNDLTGTLADTCKMKQLLNYRARADFTTEMGFMARETMAGNVFMQPWLQPMHALSAPHLLAPGSPMLLWPTQFDDLDALLKSMREVENATGGKGERDDDLISLIALSLNGDSIEDEKDLLLNTVFSLTRFGGIRQYFVAAIDDHALEACKSLNLPCYDARSQSVSSIISGLLARNRNVHLARAGNSYIDSVHKWFKLLSSQHPDAQIIGAATFGDLFIKAGEQTSSALSGWKLLDIHNLHALEQWPVASLKTATYEADRICVSAQIPADHKSAAQCGKVFYKAVGCSSATGPRHPLETIADLKKIDAWHMSACADRKHCDRQQVVPLRWVASQPDIAVIGGSCS